MQLSAWVKHYLEIWKDIMVSVIRVFNSWIETVAIVCVTVASSLLLVYLIPDHVALWVRITFGIISGLCIGAVGISWRIILNAFKSDSDSELKNMEESLCDLEKTTEKDGTEFPWQVLPENSTATPKISINDAKIITESPHISTNDAKKITYTSAIDAKGTYERAQPPPQDITASSKTSSYDIIDTAQMPPRDAAESVTASWQPQNE